VNVLIVYAHPAENSLSASLRDEAVAALRSPGHRVVISDLHAMKWKAGADHFDFGDVAEPNFMLASGEAYRAGELSADIREEQRKLLEADLVVLQFPLWWMSMPAILKGWIDRVLTLDFGYGVTRDWPRYGDGVLAGKRGMLIVTAGAREPAFSDRGIHGPMDDILFPIQHGVFHYTGIAPLPPFVVTGTVRMDEAHYAEVAADLRARLRGLDELTPVPYRPQT
jgi:NAD(P)H dehydrogenase (quinone)